VLDAIVIGAGHAGLATSYYFAQHGRSHVVLEKARVGESWRSQRWDSFTMNTPNALTVLPGRPYDGDDPEGFFSRDDFVARLERHAKDAQLPVREHSPVVRVEAASDGHGFTVTTGGPAGERLNARSVVVASGIQQMPKVPAMSTRLAAHITQLHACEYRNPARLPSGAVLVVGSAQSGCQIVEDLREGGRRVFLSTGRAGRAPRRYRGRDAFVWLASMGALDVTVDQLPDPAQQHAAQPQISGVGPRGHTVSLQQLASDGKTVLGHLEDIDGRALHFAGDLAANVRFGDAASAAVKHQIDAYIEKEHIEAPAPQLDPADEPHPNPDDLRGASGLDSDDSDITTVVWCTGFGADFSWLHLPVLDERGTPTHENGRSRVPGLFFIGFPWLRRRASGIVYGIAGDAKAIVDDVLAAL
jgi:putative flavoprotein involved in K+ transport